MNTTTTRNGKKTALITGANAGIGREIARQFAAGAGFSKVYLACRNKDKALAAKKDLEQVTGKMVFEIIIMDISKPAVVRAAASSLDHAIDVLIMNAGSVGGKTSINLTPEGVTEVFANNLLGHVVLLDELLKAKKLTSAAVYLGSEAARLAKQIGIKSPVFKSYSAEEFASVCDGNIFAGKKADEMLAFGQVKYLAAMWMSSVARKNPELRAAIAVSFSRFRPSPPIKLLYSISYNPTKRRPEQICDCRILVNYKVITRQLTGNYGFLRLAETPGVRWKLPFTQDRLFLTNIRQSVSNLLQGFQGMP